MALAFGNAGPLGNYPIHWSVNIHVRLTSSLSPPRQNWRSAAPFQKDPKRPQQWQGQRGVQRHAGPNWVRDAPRNQVSEGGVHQVQASSACVSVSSYNIELVPSPSLTSRFARSISVQTMTSLTGVNVIQVRIVSMTVVFGILMVAYSTTKVWLRSNLI